MFVREAEAGARGSVGLSDGVVWLTDSPQPRPWRAATRSTDFTRYAQTRDSESDTVFCSIVYTDDLLN